MDYLEKLRQEARVIKSAPFSFAIFLTLGMAGGYGACTWYYSKQISDNKEQISRYQVVLGIKPGSPGALVELNNRELALRAQSIIPKLRDIGTTLENRDKDIQKALKDKKIDNLQAAAEHERAQKEASQMFDGDLALDADNLRNELRRRLTPEAIAHVPRVPGFTNGTVVMPLTEMFRGTGFDVYWVGRLADEIDQMAKLLPPD
jgi:hypothetical protein